MKILRFIKSNIWIIAIIAIAGILRFYRLEQLTTFGGDQGYDFLIVKKMIVDGKFTLLGPKVGPYNNLGVLYLGPIYYYLLAIPLIIYHLDPIGPALFSVIFSLLTIAIIYKTVILFENQKIAVLAGFLYAINPLLINQSRAASNPHFIPFFASTAIYSVLLSQKNKYTSFWQYLIAGLCTGFVFQLHYLGISLFIALLLFLLIYKKIKKVTYFIIGFLIIQIPQAIFEFRHNFFITQEFIKQFKFANNISHPVSVLGQLQTITNVVFETIVSNTIIFSLVIIIGFFVLLIKNKQNNCLLTISLLNTLILVLLLTLYKGPINIHYFASIYSSVIILTSLSFWNLFKIAKNNILKGLILIFLLFSFYLNIQKLNLNSNHGYTMPDGWNMVGIKKAAKMIASDRDSNNKFNIASTLDGDTRAMPYRYLLESYGKIPLDVEHYPQSDIVFLVSRDEEETIKSYTVWEVSSFQPFNILRIGEVQNGIKVYKLTKNE